MNTATMTNDERPRSAWTAWRGLWGALLVQALLLWWHLGRDGFWLDEMTSLWVGAGPLDRAVAFFRMFPEQHPLYYVLLRAWLVLGESEAMLRAFSAVCVLASTPLLYLFGRETLDERRARIAVGLAATSPFLLYYGQEGRMYAPLLLAGLASTLAFSRWLRAPTPSRAVWYVLLSVAAVYTHLFAVFVVVSHVVWAFCDPASRRRRLSAFGLASIVAVAYGPWLAFILMHPAAPQEWKSWLNVVFGIPYTAMRWAVGYSVLVANAGWKQELVALARADAPILASAAIAFGWIAWRGGAVMRRAWRREGLVLSLLLVPPLLAVAASPVAILVSERYLIVSFPAFLLLLASGLEALRADPRPLVRLVAPGLLFLSQAIALQRYYFRADFGKAEWREVAAFVTAERAPTDAVLLHDAAVETVFRHYYPSGLPTPRTTGEAGVVDSLSSVQRVWVVIGHAADGGRPLLERLGTTHAVLRDTIFAKDVGIRVLLLGPR